MGVLQQLSYRKPRPLKECLARENVNSLVLPAPQFAEALRRERRRTERSQRPFVLMLATLEAVPTQKNRSRVLDNLASALSSGCRETDIVGWHESDTVGAIFTELDLDNRTAILASLKDKVWPLLHERLSATDARDVTLVFLCYPEDFGHDEHSAFQLPTEVYGKERPKRLARGLKRIIDITGSAMALLVLSPLLLAIGLIIKLTSKGPVLFRQVRVGQHGKKFTFLKFRSMYVNSDVTRHKEYVSHFIAGNAQLKRSADGKSSAYKLIDDPRVTSFGRFLRKTSLDEFPQLINALQGDLSLVGSRPPIPYELACYHIWHRRRIAEIKPGITGLWQVCGRSKTSFDEMVRMDLRYATSWSLWLDFMILLRTPRVVLSRDGAH